MDPASDLSITTIDDGNKQQLSVLRVDGNARDMFIELLNRRALVQGSPVSTGGAVNKSALLNLLGAIGSGVASGSMSSSLFVATANPSTLMRIGGGLGSAVMGSSGIIAQAPFIPAAAAIMPIAAPIIAYQALQTGVILKEFEKVNEKLDDLQDAVASLAYSIEVEAFGRLMSVMEISRSLADEYSYTKRFSSGMLSRLAVIEFECNALFNRYEFKYRRDMLEIKKPKPDCTELLQNTYGMVLSSIASLQVDELKLKAVLQEEPEYLEQAQLKLSGKTSCYNALWHELQDVSRVIKEEYIDVTKKMNESPAIVQALPWNWSSNEKRKDKANRLLEVSSSFEETFSEPLKNIIEYNQYPLKENLQETKLLYWVDNSGEHSYCTDDDFEELLKVEGA